jgi:hypothetical protein
MPDETNPQEDGSDMSQARGVNYERAEGVPHIIRPKDKLQENLQPKDSIFARLFRGGLTVSTSEKPGMHVPYVVAGFILTFFIWAAGMTCAAVWAFASMSTNMQNLSNSVTQQTIRDAEERKKLQEENMLLRTYVQNDRERIIKLEAQQRGRN